MEREAQAMLGHLPSWWADGWNLGSAVFLQGYAQTAELTGPSSLFADGVCLIDPEYLKDRKGINTENPVF